MITERKRLCEHGDSIYDNIKTANIGRSVQRIWSMGVTLRDRKWKHGDSVHDYIKTTKMRSLV